MERWNIGKTGWLLAIVVCLFVAEAQGAPLTVKSLDELEKSMQGLEPGATVLLADGLYETTGPLRIEGKRGTADAPIMIRAEHRGQAVIGGEAGFVIKDCEYLALEGFVLTHDADKPAVLLDNCRYVQVTRNRFALRERAKPRHWEHWVYAIGTQSAHNRIDHNLFERKVNRGSHVFVRAAMMLRSSVRSMTALITTTSAMSSTPMAKTATKRSSPAATTSAPAVRARSRSSRTTFWSNVAARARSCR
jgi:hypothetical protein